MDLIYQTQQELHEFRIYDEDDIAAFSKVYFAKGSQSNNRGKMSSVLLPVAARYNQKDEEEQCQFQRRLRSLIKWYRSSFFAHYLCGKCRPVFQHILASI